MLDKLCYTKIDCRYSPVSQGSLSTKWKIITSSVELGISIAPMVVVLIFFGGNHMNEAYNAGMFILAVFSALWGYIGSLKMAEFFLHISSY